MTALEKIKAWIATFPDFDILGNFRVDYTDHVDPGSCGIFPSGLVEVERREDIVGNVEITKQYNFGIHCVFEMAPGDDVGAAINEDWIMDFQEWVQEQSVLGLAPTFGNTDAGHEVIQAQNGALYETGEGTATYMVQLSVQFKKRFEV